MGEELDRISEEVKKISDKLKEIKTGEKHKEDETPTAQTEDIDGKPGKREKTDYSDLHEKSHLEQEELEELEKNLDKTREKIQEEFWEDIEKPHSQYPGFRAGGKTEESEQSEEIEPGERPEEKVSESKTDALEREKAPLEQETQRAERETKKELAGSSSKKEDFRERQPSEENMETDVAREREKGNEKTQENSGNPSKSPEKGSEFTGKNEELTKKQKLFRDKIKFAMEKADSGAIKQAQKMYNSLVGEFRGLKARGVVGTEEHKMMEELHEHVNKSK